MTWSDAPLLKGDGQSRVPSDGGRFLGLEVVFRIQQLADKSLAPRTHAGKVCRFLEPCFAIAPDGLWRGEGKCAPVQRYLSALAGKIESTRRELYDKIPSATRLDSDYRRVPNAGGYMLHFSR